jgi:hypothetical protein
MSDWITKKDSEEKKNWITKKDKSEEKKNWITKKDKSEEKKNWITKKDPEEIQDKARVNKKSGGLVKSGKPKIAKKGWR